MKATLLKNMFLIACLCTIINNYSQTTAIPDPSFENYLETHSNNFAYSQYTGEVVPLGDPNSMGDGVIDGFVPTAKINAIISLDVSLVGTIADLTGIEDFTALENLICEGNMITSLKLDQNTALTSLFANANQLTELNVKNGNNVNFTSFMTSNNPNLSCIEVDNEAYSTANWTNIDATSSFSESCSSISGVVSFDCTSLTPQQNIQIKATATTSGNIYYRTTDNNGFYSFSINETGTVTTEVVAQNLSSTPVNYANNYNGQTIENQDFCVNSVTTGDDVHITIIPITPAPRPGFNSTYKIYYGNYGSTTVSGTLNYTFDDTKVGTPTSSDSFTQNGNTFTWAYTNLAPFEIRCIEIVLPVNPAQGTNAVVSGDYLIHTVNIEPITGDTFPTDNTFEIEETVVNAYDPNDITIIEGPYIQPTQSTDDLNFRIRFQNTGTASAVNINVKTTLDTHIDLATFQPIAGSHAYTTSIQNTNEITFTFSNINLDYEANNEPASHGWVTFKAKPVTGFAIGDIINAQADIFFDTNPAIVTNTATLQIAPPTLTYVPDNNFENYLETHDASGNMVAIGATNSIGNGIANDDYVTTANINNIHILNVINKNISDLTGIEDFTNTTILNVAGNNLSSVDLSYNINLQSFTVSSNPITSLDLSQNLNLISLGINNTLITTIDLSSNINLGSFGCFNTPLTELDLSANINFTSLYCTANTSLTYLNVKNGNNTNVGQFTVTNNPILTCIEVDDKAYSTVNWLQIDSTNSFNNNCANPETHIPDDNFENYLETHDENGNIVTIGATNSMGNGIANDDYVTTANINTVTTLNVSSKNIADLTGIEDFVLLENLDAYDNQLTSVNLINNASLIDVELGVNALTVIDISQNLNLERLGLGTNQLTTLSVIGNLLLKDLDFQNNQISIINIANNNLLESLKCSNNQLNNLSVTTNTLLEDLYCDYNNLTAINLSTNPNLIYLSCNDNMITNLAVSANTVLVNLSVSNNQLSALNTDSNTVLERLFCNGNQITSLNTSLNLALKDLICHGNLLTDLDMSNNTLLEVLDFNDNALINLDLSVNSNLIDLNCQSNSLSSLNVKNGNNTNFINFITFNNPNLTCIEVDNASWSTTNWTNLDSTSTFVNNQTECTALSTDKINKLAFSVYPNP